MTEATELVCLGVDWADPDRPTLRVAKVGARESTTIPLIGTLRFRASELEGRYCCGWFDLTGAAPIHVTCGTWERLKSGTQCERCQRREGFIAAHRAHKGGQLPANVRAYLRHPHWLYVSMSADGSAKVGTAADSRRDTRIAEQGALAADFLARTEDGLIVRRLEEALAARCGLPQSVPTSRKLRALTKTVDVEALKSRLDAVVHEVHPELAAIASNDFGVQIFDTPRQWALPPVAATVFEATPLTLYPGDLTRGSHTLPVTGASGVLAVFRVTRASAGLYVANIAPLRGRVFIVGEDDCMAPATQMDLF